MSPLDLRCFGEPKLAPERRSTRIDRSPVSDSQRAHIHEGTCDDLTPDPAYALPNVTTGSSDGTVDVSLDTPTSGEYAINLHMSDEDLATYTSCGHFD